MSRRGNYYTPGILRLDVPGLQKHASNESLCFDCFIGDMGTLVSAGLATPDMFPGQEGRPGATVSYRPTGAWVKHSWFRVPGYMTIRTRPDERFHISLTVSLDEQERRKAAQLARLAQKHDAMRRRWLQPAPPVVRSPLRLVWSAQC